MQKILSIDFGTKRVGLASYEEGNVLAFSDSPIIYSDYGVMIGQLTELIKNQNYNMIILGLPLGIDNKETQMSQKVRLFCDDLKKELNPAIQIIMWNEILTSKVAGNNLRKMKFSKSIDSESARIILQEYLDHNNEKTRT